MNTDDMGWDYFFNITQDEIIQEAYLWNVWSGLYIGV